MATYLAYGGETARVAPAAGLPLSPAPSLLWSRGCSSGDVASLYPFRNFACLSLSFSCCSPWKGSKMGVLPLSRDTATTKTAAHSDEAPSFLLKGAL